MRVLTGYDYRLQLYSRRTTVPGKVFTAIVAAGFAWMLCRAGL